MTNVDPPVPVPASDSKPWWQSTTATAAVGAAAAFISILVSTLLPQITSVEITGFIHQLWDVVSGVLGLIASAAVIYGRLHTDGKKLTLTRPHRPTLAELS